jgi:RES domain-containing protein
LIEVYRITKQPNGKKAFSGTGARLYGGRWNSVGIEAVYASAHRSLSVLEVLVHIEDDEVGSGTVVRPYLVYPISFNEALLEELSAPSLPVDWASHPPVKSTQQIGDDWVSRAGSPVLSVPSVVVPEERNYVLNPNHKRFAEIQIGLPVPCKIDPRLL